MYRVSSGCALTGAAPAVCAVVSAIVLIRADRRYAGPPPLAPLYRLSSQEDAIDADRHTAPSCLPPCLRGETSSSLLLLFQPRQVLDQVAHLPARQVLDQV